MSTNKSSTEPKDPPSIYPYEKWRDRELTGQERVQVKREWNGWNSQIDLCPLDDIWVADTAMDMLTRLKDINPRWGSLLNEHSPIQYFKF
jgi:hypothetical protein